MDLHSENSEYSSLFYGIDIEVPILTVVIKDISIWIMRLLPLHS